MGGGAPLIPEAGLSIGLILLAMACVFLLALNKAWLFTVGAMLRTIANMFRSIRTPHLPIVGSFSLGFIGDALEGVDHYVLLAIGSGIIATEKGLHALLGWMTWLLQETADQVAGLAEDTAKAFDYTKRILIPALLGVALTPIVRELAHLGGKVKEAVTHPVAAVHTTVRVIAPGLHALTGRVSALEAKVAAIGAAAPAVVSSSVGAIERLPPLAIPGEITRGIESLWKRVRWIGRTLTPAGIAALVVGALGLLGLGWTRCSNVTKVGKRLCGMNPSALEDLLAGTILIASSISIVELAKECQAFTGEVDAGLKLFVRELS